LTNFSPLNAELNPICHPLVFLGAHHILHVSGIRVKSEGIPAGKKAVYPSEMLVTKD